MGLFNFGKSEDQLIAEAYNKVGGASMVSCKVVVGTYGNDDIVAGAMMGETGKLIAMNNYGNPKWESSVLEFHVNGIVFTNPGWSIMYDDIIDLKLTRQGIRHSEMTMFLSDGNRIVCEMEKYELIASVQRMTELKTEYLERMEQERLEQEKQEVEKEESNDADRLLRAAELYERGLLTEDEFEELKKKLL